MLTLAKWLALADMPVPVSPSQLIAWHAEIPEQEALQLPARRGNELYLAAARDAATIEAQASNPGLEAWGDYIFDPEPTYGQMCDLADAIALQPASLRARAILAIFAALPTDTGYDGPARLKRMDDFDDLPAIPAVRALAFFLPRWINMAADIHKYLRQIRAMLQMPPHMPPPPAQAKA